MLSEFDKLVQQRKELKAWYALGSTEAVYDRKNHSLRVDVTTPGMVAFCGQQYAGAKNYHDAPAFFVEAVRQQMAEEARATVHRAYEKELARLDAEIEKHRDAVLEQLA